MAVNKWLGTFDKPVTLEAGTVTLELDGFVAFDRRQAHLMFALWVPDGDEHRQELKALFEHICSEGFELKVPTPTRGPLKRKAVPSRDQAPATIPGRPNKRNLKIHRGL